MHWHNFTIPYINAPRDALKTCLPMKNAKKHATLQYAIMTTTLAIHVAKGAYISNLEMETAIKPACVLAAHLIFLTAANVRLIFLEMGFVTKNVRMTSVTMTIMTAYSAHPTVKMVC